MRADEVLLKQGNVEVSATRLVVGSKTHSLSGVLQARCDVLIPPLRELAVALVAWALSTFALSYTLGHIYQFMESVVFVLMTALGLFWAIRAYTKPPHALVLRSHHREVTALVDRDSEKIQVLANAVNSALRM